MDTRRIIFLSFLGFFFVLFLFLAIRFYPAIERLYYRQTLPEKKLIIADSHVSFFPSSGDRAVFLVSDIRTDRYWNTHYHQTNTGLYITRLLLEKNYSVYLYDRLDANYDANFFEAPSRLQAQLVRIWQALEKESSSAESKKILLAHGDGCLVSLLALQEINIFEKLYLMNCGFPGSLLDYYIHVILHTMEISGVDEEIKREAKQIIAEWKEKKEFETITREEWMKKQKEMVERKVHPDIIALKKTLARFQFPENLEFLKEAGTVYFTELLEKVLKTDQEIIHILSTKDEEYPGEFIKYFQEYFRERKHYRLYIFENSDHFLFRLEKKLLSPAEIAIHRNNPFKEISGEFLDFLKREF